MDKHQLLRRTGKLCLFAVRNFAYSRAAHDAQSKWRYQQFWIAVANNALDIGILEWCKVFADKKAEHAWRRSINDQALFLAELLTHLRLTESMFDAYLQEMRTYRDKFVAHLDRENQMNIPDLSAAIKSAQFLYKWLVDKEDDGGAFSDSPSDAVGYFRDSFAEAQNVYSKMELSKASSAGSR